MVTIRINAAALNDVSALIEPELRAAVSEADLERRLARLGYGVRHEGGGRALVTLPHGVRLMRLSDPAFLRG